MRADPKRLALEVHQIIRGHYKLVTSCIEAAYLFQRAALNLGEDVRRSVAQVMAYSPLLAEEIAKGKTMQECSDLAGKPGYWAVAVGYPESASDRFGASDRRRNRYVGHVVCTVEDRDHMLVIDPSADQMNRPLYGLKIDEPVVSRVPRLTRHILLRSDDGVMISYDLFPDMPLPLPRTQAWLDRQARVLADRVRSTERRSIHRLVRSA